MDAHQLQHGPNPASTSLVGLAGSASSAATFPLPDPSTVDTNNLEDAYIQFIMSCNPAVPRTVDTSDLRAAFHHPPRSGGKSFSISILFDLIRRLDVDEIKTWGELALQLGVTPPDETLGQSSQKIQQYAVRLKRWMRSMHVDAFFNYLLDRPQGYSLNIPPASIPISRLVRDGVYAKDDMALRALIPEIKPRRGRRRPDDEPDQNMPQSHAPSLQADGVDSASATDGTVFPPPMPHLPPSGIGTVASSEGVLHTPSAGVTAGWPDAYSNGMSSPLSAYPPSAITPTGAHTSFLPDETNFVMPSPASSTSRRSGRRHGAKAVSSAWRSTSGRGARKARGRPPINHKDGSNASQTVSHQSPDSPTADHTTSAFQPPPTAIPPNMDQHPSSGSPFLSSTISAFQRLPLSDDRNQATTAAYNSTRPGLPPLQLPRRKGADVSLARLSHPQMPATLGVHSTALGTSGEPSAAAQLHHPGAWSLYDLSPEGLLPPLGMTPFDPFSVTTPGMHSLPSPPPTALAGTTAAMATVPDASAAVGAPSGSNFGPTTFRESASLNSSAASYTVPDPTSAPASSSTAKEWPLSDGLGPIRGGVNKTELEAYFFNVMFSAIWVDANDQPDTMCSIQEADALMQAILEDLTKSSASKETFLINLAALAGGSILIAFPETKFKRAEKTAEYTRYDCSWKLGYGDVFGQFNLQEKVYHSKWKPMTSEVQAAVAHSVGLDLNAEKALIVAESGELFPEDTPMWDAATTAFRTTATSSASRTLAEPHGLPSRPPLAGEDAGNNPEAALADLWKRKYLDLVRLVRDKDRELSQIRTSVLQSLRASRQGPVQIYTSGPRQGPGPGSGI